VTGYILRRVAFAIPTLFIVSVGIFLMVRLLPGDIIDILFGGDLSASEEVKAKAREQLGLNGSYPEQYWRWISHMFQGDLGRSLITSQPITETLRTALPITIELVFLGLLIAVAVGLPLGVISAVKRDSVHDYGARVTGLVGISIPNFWLATLLLIFTSRVLHWVPPLQYVPFYEDPKKNLEAFILPAIAISVFTLAIVMRMVRATMLEVLSLDYVRTARAKGLFERSVILKHAMRNALTPVITLGALELGTLLSGAVLTEQIFSIPGFGKLIVDAVFNRDYAVVQGVVLTTATIYITLNLIADIAYVLVNPRLRA